MNKSMKKSTTSMFVVLVIVSLLASTLAVYDIFWKETVKEQNLGRLENNEIILGLRTNKKLVNGSANEEERSIFLCVRYNKNKNRVYEWRISDYPAEKFTPQEESFWYDVIEYAEKRPAEANVIDVKHHLFW